MADHDTACPYPAVVLVLPGGFLLGPRVLAFRMAVSPGLGAVEFPAVFACATGEESSAAG